MRLYLDQSFVGAIDFPLVAIVIICLAMFPSQYYAQSMNYDQQVILSLKVSLRNAGLELSGIEDSHEKFVYCAKQVLSLENLDCYRLEDDSRSMAYRLGVDCSLILKSKNWMRAVHGLDIKCATLMLDQPLELISEDGTDCLIRVDKEALIKR